MEFSGCEDEDTNRGLQTLLVMVSDLVEYCRGVGKEVEEIEGRVKTIESKVDGL